MNGQGQATEGTDPFTGLSGSVISASVWHLAGLTCGPQSVATRANRGKAGLPRSGQGAGKQERLTLMPFRPCPRTRWNACPSTTSQPGATTRPSRRPVIGVCPARSLRTRPRTVSARGHPTHLHPRGWTAVSGSGHHGDPPCPHPRLGEALPDDQLLVSVEIAAVTGLWWPLSANLSPYGDS